MFIPIPSAPGTSDTRLNYWSSEKECHKWLLDILYDTPEMEVFDEPRLVDIYGNKARADIGVVLRHNGASFFFVIELKHQVTRATNAASAYIQAYHYREMCVVDDERLPMWVNGASPTYAFAGVFTHAGDRVGNHQIGYKPDHHEYRCSGMAVLATNMKVGSIMLDTRNDRLSFHAGEMRLFNTQGVGKKVDWQTTADAYLFGGERRNGGRRARQSVAEKFFEMQQTFKELF